MSHAPMWFWLISVELTAGSELSSGRSFPGHAPTAPKPVAVGYTSPTPPPRSSAWNEVPMPAPPKPVSSPPAQSAWKWASTDTEPEMLPFVPNPEVLPPSRVHVPPGELNAATAALFRAVQDADMDTVASLLRSRGKRAATDAEIDGMWMSSKGRTPLMFAAFLAGPAALNMTTLLLDFGADINKQSTSGATALMYSALRCNPDVTRALLAAGVRDAQ